MPYLMGNLYISHPYMPYLIEDAEEEGVEEREGGEEERKEERRWEEEEGIIQSQNKV